MSKLTRLISKAIDRLNKEKAQQTPDSEIDKAYQLVLQDLTRARSIVNGYVEQPKWKNKDDVQL